MFADGSVLFVRFADVPFDKAGPAAGGPASPERVFGREGRGRSRHQNRISHHSGGGDDGGGGRRSSRAPPRRRRTSFERG